jgi:hypothetical protein
VARRPPEREWIYLDRGRRTTQLMRDSLGANEFSLHQQRVTSPPSVSEQVRPLFRLPRLIRYSAVVVLVLRLASCGYGPKRPIARWPLPNGDTVDVLTNENEYSYTYSVNGRSTVAHYLWIQFRSWPNDSARDERDVASMIQLVCPDATSRGYRKMNIEPATLGPFGLKYSHSHWATVDSLGHCVLNNHQ